MPVQPVLKKLHQPGAGKGRSLPLRETVSLWNSKQLRLTTTTQGRQQLIHLDSLGSISKRKSSDQSKKRKLKMRRSRAGVKATKIWSIANKNRLTPTTITCNWDCRLTVKRAGERVWLTKKTKSFSLKTTWFKPQVGRPTSEQMTRASLAHAKCSSSQSNFRVQPSKSFTEKKVSRKKHVFQESSQSLRIRLRFRRTKISWLKTRKMFSWSWGIATVKLRTRRWHKISRAILMMTCAL